MCVCVCVMERERGEVTKGGGRKRETERLIK